MLKINNGIEFVALMLIPNIRKNKADKIKGKNNGNPKSKAPSEFFISKIKQKKVGNKAT